MGITLETARKPAAVSAHRPQGTGRQKTSTAGTEAQRDCILKVAARLFAAQGYANTTIDQIARELGVTKPFVYYYFRDKQELFEIMSWPATVDCFTALDFADADPRPAREKVMEGLERLIRGTLQHHPVAFFPYREPQAYRPEYLDAARRVAKHFYDKLCPLLEEARRDGELNFRNTKITALAACSLPGFLYTWYRPDGKLSPDEVVAELTLLASRVIGLQEKR